MKFNPKTAESAFLKKEDEELIQIAYVEESYVTEAKELAKSVLAKRGLSNLSDADIDRVRKELEVRADAIREHELRNVEVEEEMPSWRRSIRGRLAPYRKYTSIAFVVLGTTYFLNSWFGWRLLGLDSRKSDAVMGLVMLMYLVFFMPDRKEFLELQRKNRNQS
jgi:hypothetical protein